MFNKLCLTSKNGQDNNLDIAFLLDSLLFYKDVNIVLSQNDLHFIFDKLNEDVIYNLAKNNNVSLFYETHPRAAYVSLMGNPTFHFIGFHNQDNNIHSDLYQIHRKRIKNSINNFKFADKFSEIIKPFTYEDNIKNQALGDFTNIDYMKGVTPIMLNNLIPPDDFYINLSEYHGRPSLSDDVVYRIDSNILDRVEPDKNKHNNYLANVYLRIVSEIFNARTLTYTGGFFDCELATDSSASAVLELHWKDIAKKNREEIASFNRHVLADTPSIGNSYLAGNISDGTLIDIINKGDKFRSWLSEIPEGSDLINEYIKEITAKTIADNPGIKFLRQIAIALFGLINPLCGFSTSLIDTFIIEKIAQGWKPSHFIDNTLKPNLK